MNVLLTGASGFLGSCLYRSLRHSDHVTTLGRKIVSPDAVVCDLAAQTPDLGGYRFDYVVHAAGKAHSVPGNPAEEAEYEEVNVQGLRRLLAALEKSGALPEAFVHLSTVLVYGCPEGVGLDEATPLRAADPYGRSKVRAEEVLCAWGDRTGVRITVLRLPLVVGRQPQGNLAALIRAIQGRRYVRIGSGSARRSMVLADDVAGIIPAAARAGGIYNLTDGVHPSVRELEEAIARQAGGRFIPSLSPVLAKGIALTGDGINRLIGRRFPLDSAVLTRLTHTLTFSDDRARNQLGWQPRPVTTFFT
ncbi:NAD-dependent epimerase/dehydratase family protein [Larkinella soli]|uniref:NAD-dependent epimerase/dehydratase family protein n=1 Tax=Larkinella soli TaxID=1770527 RepID=UPI000FFC1DA2|nr:NAD-dependent epimerase/dehydratase family protein [Larkinella soli]